MFPSGELFPHILCLSLRPLAKVGLDSSPPLKEPTKNPGVLPMGFSPRQVHYGFSVTKEIDSKTFSGRKGYMQLYFQVAGQSLKSHSLRASLHAASQSLPLGPNVCTAVPHSHPLGLCPRCCHHSSFCSALLQPCSCVTMSRPEHWVELFI